MLLSETDASLTAVPPELYSTYFIPGTFHPEVFQGHKSYHFASAASANANPPVFMADKNAHLTLRLPEYNDRKQIGFTERVIRIR